MTTMEKSELLAKLQEIFRDVFDNDEIVITAETVAEDIEEWDSLAHIQLAKELETVFNVKLTAKEIMTWDNVGEMAESILKKIG